jgi:hypothetical protein
MSTTISRPHFLAAFAVISSFSLALGFIVLASPHYRSPDYAPRIYIVPPDSPSTTPQFPSPTITVETPIPDPFEGVQPHVAVVGKFLQEEFAIKTIYGKADRPNNPTSDHPGGLALDFMVDDMDIGDDLNQCVHDHEKEWNIKYTLWQVKDHYNHVHVSFEDSEDEDEPEELTCGDWL